MSGVEGKYMKSWLGSREGLAGALILATAVIFSLMPLAIVAGGGPESPFLFNAVFRLGTILGYLVIIGVLYGPWLRRPAVWRALGRGIFTRVFVGAAALHPFEFFFFAAAAALLDPSLATLLYYAFPFFFVLLMLRLRRLSAAGRLRRWFLLLGLSALGLLLALVSQQGGLDFSGITLERWLGGFLIGAFSALAAACIAFSLRWGTDFALRLPGEMRREGDLWRPPALLGALLVVCLTSALGGLVSLGLGWFRGESFAAVDTASWVIWGLGGGGLISGLTGGTYRLANLLVENLGLNGMMYFTPLFSIGLLLLLGWSTVVWPLGLFLGGGLVAAANVLLMFPLERKLQALFKGWGAGFLEWKALAKERRLRR